jgi:hypothetical protein
MALNAGMSKIGVPPLTNGDLRPMTNAERQQKWRLVHNGSPKHPKRDLLVTCIPRGPLDRAEVERSGGATLALYDRIVDIVTTWVDGLDPAKLSTADGLLAFRLLAPTLDSLVTLQAKIAEQRVTEARGATAQAAPPKIAETLELLRSRFNDIKKPKAT